MHNTLKSLRHRLKRTVWPRVVEPFSNPYLAPQYEALWGKNKTLMYSAMGSFRRRRDARIFRVNVRPTDVFIVGHPKSGNTWLAYMVAILMRQDVAGMVTMANVGKFVPVIHGRDARISEYDGLPDPRAFRNEWPLFRELYPKTIYIVRDPRAALVSYYHMYRTIFPGDDVTMEAFVAEYLRYGEIRKWEPLMRWDRQVSSWLNRARTDKSILVVKYEDMVADRGGSLQRIVEFCGIPCDPATMALAVERGNFSAMRANEEKFGAESYVVKPGRKGHFVRAGKVDGWREEMPAELIRSIEQAFAGLMREMGYL